MLKSYRKLIIIYFFILWGIFVVFRILRAVFIREAVDFTVLATGTLWVIVFCVVYWAYLVRRFHPRLKYIETGRVELPGFTGLTIGRMPWKGDDFPLKPLQEVLSKKLEVTYFDESENVIKVRSRFRMRSWGACSVVLWQPERELVIVASYPMANHTIRQGREGEKQNAAITGLIEWMHSEKEESNEL